MSMISVPTPIAGLSLIVHLIIIGSAYFAGLFKKKPETDE